MNAAHEWAATDRWLNESMSALYILPEKTTSHTGL